MIIDTIKLSVTNDTTIQLSGNTQCALDGRRLKRSATGGRFFVVADNVINVRLERSGEYRNQELTLTPPVSVVINGNQKYDGVTKLEFIGDTMRVNSDADQIHRENVNRLNAEVQNLAGQEARLNQELNAKQEAIRQLEAANLAAERQIAQLSGTAASLQSQRKDPQQDAADHNGKIQYLQIASNTGQQ